MRTPSSRLKAGGSGRDDETVLIPRPRPPVAAREIARRFWPFARPYRKQLLFGLFLILLVPAIDTAEIWLFKLVVDDVLVPKDVAALMPATLRSCSSRLRPLSA